jgi:SsrA-binding protein
MSDSIKVIATNRRARHEYFILDTVEAGIVLTGAEVKSVRLGKVSLADAFCAAVGGEMWLKNAQITPYEKGSYFNNDARADRKLLLHHAEIQKLAGQAGQQGLAIVPLQIYLKGSLVKVEIALVKGKKLYDKRESIKQRDVKRAAERDMADYR